MLVKFQALALASLLLSTPDMNPARLCTALILVFGLVACESTSGGNFDAQPPGGVDGGGSSCQHPLDADTLANLATGFEPNIAMQPGESMTLALGTVECCYAFQPVDACATWSVSPAVGASIDPSTGNLVIADTAHNGDVFTVTANVEDGRRLVKTDVYVYTPAANPLYGIWRETAQLSCGSGTQVDPSSPINELRFRADGTMTVTWMPFELYVDYWGSYSYDLISGSLSLKVSGGNYVPDDIDPVGTFSIDNNGNLILHDLWLGSPQQSTAPVNCGHVFSRIGL